MAEANKERTLGVPLEPEDEAALAYVRAIAQQSCGYGIRVTDAAAIRWALHACAAAYGAYDEVVGVSPTESTERN